MAKKSKEKIASPVKSQKGLEVLYRRELNKLGKAMVLAIRKDILSFLKNNEASYVADEIITEIAKPNLALIVDELGSDYLYMLTDEYVELRDSIYIKSVKKLIQQNFKDAGFANTLSRLFETQREHFTGTITATFSEQTAEEIVNKTVANNKKKFDRTIKVSTGVDLGSLVATEGLDDFIELSVNKNVSLIKSLPEEYLKQVETIVNNGVVSGAKYSTIEKEIISKTGANSKLFNRIKTIARNEIQTVNSQISLRRSENLGVDEGIYRTSEDERVRECHRELNGVKYKINKGAWSKSCQKYIQPGITDINCRCTFSPVIEVQ